MEVQIRKISGRFLDSVCVGFLVGYEIIGGNGWMRWIVADDYTPYEIGTTMKATPEMIEQEATNAV